MRERGKFHFLTNTRLRQGDIHAKFSCDASSSVGEVQRQADRQTETPATVQGREKRTMHILYQFCLRKLNKKAHCYTNTNLRIKIHQTTKTTQLDIHIKVQLEK